MKLALPWTSNKQNFDIPCEYNINFVNKTNNFDELIEFLSLHPTERFNISIDTSEYSFDFNKLKVLNNINHNIYIKLTSDNLNQYKVLKSLNIKFFFDYHFSVSNYHMLENIAKLGVTDIYIIDDLCYDLENVRKACNKLNISLRWILDAIPCGDVEQRSDPRAPWVIPENIDELAKYIDTFEFLENESWARLDTLYKIWFKDKRWRENLKILYPQLKVDIWNQSLLPNLTKYKLNCRYKCAYGSNCNKCKQNVEIATNLHSKNFVYDVPRKR